MSFRVDHFQHFVASKSFENHLIPEDLSVDELKSLFLEILNSGIHGLCFSLYEEGQKPGDIISESQIRRRLDILRPYTKWIRSFSTTEGNELIPIIAKEYGMKTLVGAWLGDEEEKNQVEIDNLIQLGKDGMVDVAAVGNEVLYRNDLSVDQLISHLRFVKSQLPDIPVGYVDAYYEFVQHPEISDLCDVILTNCYPFWEGTSLEHSYQHIRHMFGQSLQAANGKKVIITETGWPSQGQALGGAIPSPINALKYFLTTQLWCLDEGVDLFYFSSFDESWKVGNEGDVGAFWGIWDSVGKLKYVNDTL